MNRSCIAAVSVAAALTMGCSQPAAPPARTAPAASAPAPVAAAAAADPHVHGPGGAHSDHDPKQGGILYMSGNVFHHFEGTYLEPGVFRLHLYDDHTKPIDAAPTSGSIRVESAPDVEIPLTYEPATRTLVARIDPPPATPLVVLLTVNLTEPRTGAQSQEKHRFPFAAAGPVVIPGVSHGHASGEDHAHGSPHGGQVVSAGDEHHLELVLTGSTLVLWVLDAAEQTLPVGGMNATLVLQPEGGAALTLPMPPMGTVHFMADSPLAPGQEAVAVATVTIDGKARTGRLMLGAQ